VCDIIWCKKILEDGKPCETVNYLDPYCFWNWKGNVNCAHCGTVYYVHLINGHMYEGPTEQPAGTKPDMMPLYADRPLAGWRYCWQLRLQLGHQDTCSGCLGGVSEDAPRRRSEGMVRRKE